MMIFRPHHLAAYAAQCIEKRALEKLEAELRTPGE